MSKIHHLSCNPMPQLSAPPYWSLQQAVPSPIPSSPPHFLQKAKGSKPLLQKPSSLGAPRFPLPGELPLLLKVRIPDPMKTTLGASLVASSEPVGNMHDNTSSFLRRSFLASPPLTPPAIPPSCDSPNSPATLMMRTPTPTPQPSSTPPTPCQFLSPLPTAQFKALTPLPRLRPLTTWDYYIQTQGMQVPCPLYHEAKVRKGKKMVKKPKKY